MGPVSHLFWCPGAKLKNGALIRPAPSIGTPLLVLEWGPIRHADLSFSFFSLSFPPFSSLFILFPFLFPLSWHPFSSPGGKDPPKPPGYAAGCLVSSFGVMLFQNNNDNQ